MQKQKKTKISKKFDELEKLNKAIENNDNTKKKIPAIKKTKEQNSIITKEPKLTRKQKIFVEEYLSNGRVHTQAALKAYDTKDYGTANAIGYENLQKPAVKHYLQSFGDKAGSKIVELIDSKKEQIALQASIYTYDQVHGKAIQKTETTHKLTLQAPSNVIPIDNIIDGYMTQNTETLVTKPIDTIDNY